MANKQINARIITKHDKEENWAKAVNFIPKLGEIIVYEPDSTNLIPRLKVGNGLDVISSLPFITDSFVIKENGKGLSTNDFTDTFHQKVAAIPDDPKYTDTTYSAGKEIGLSGTTFYNKGIIRISAALEPSSFNVITRTGPGEDDYTTQLVSLTGIDNKTKQNLLDTMTQQLPTLITTGTINGAIMVNTTNVPIKGWDQLGELAFMDVADLESLGSGEGIEEVTIAAPDSVNLTPTIKLWYNTADDMLYYRDGTAYNPAFPNMITSIDESSNAGYITVHSFESTYDIQVGSAMTFESGTTNGAFTVTQNGTAQSVTIYGLGSNAYTSTAYLPLTGGTITGTTIFSNTTNSTSTTTGAVKINGGLGVANNIYAKEVHGAVWNDYAEFRSANSIEAGRVVVEDGKDNLVLSTKRLMVGGNIISDTFGFSIGKTEKAQTPIAVCGRVLAYTYEPRNSYMPGDAVCTGPRGTVSRMTRAEITQFPDRIIGYVSCVPDYEVWGEANVEVNGRIWIKVI